MGRYSSVQAYTDQQNTRTTSYEQEKGSSSTVKAEKVHNPYGSTAGAGSGEFHVYRHARAREQERLKALDDSEQEQKDELDFQTKVQGWKSEEEKRLNKKRKKREREKSAKIRKKNLSLSGVKVTSSNEADNGADEIGEDEFEYAPLHLRQENKQQDDDNTKIENVGKDADTSSNAATSDTIQTSEGKNSIAPPFVNDGSFMEMMKKKMQEEAKAKSGKMVETSQPEER
jgi:hypothetical protein